MLVHKWNPLLMSVLLIVSKTHSCAKRSPILETLGTCRTAHLVVAAVQREWMREKKQTIQTAIACTTNRNLWHHKTVERVKWSRSGDCCDDDEKSKKKKKTKTRPEPGGKQTQNMDPQAKRIRWSSLRWTIVSLTTTVGLFAYIFFLLHLSCVLETIM